MTPRVLFFVIGAGVVALAVWAALPAKVSNSNSAPHADANLDAAVQSCVDAQRLVAAQRRLRGGPSLPGQPSDAAVVARRCAPLFADADCRAALEGFDDPPVEARAATVVQRCSRAYCGKLEQKPRVCTAPPDEESQMAAAWGELRDAILRHDHGADVATRVADALKDSR